METNSKIIDIKDIIATYRPQDRLENPFFDTDYAVAPEPWNIKLIRELKGRFWNVLWYNFMRDYLRQALNWKNILWEENIKNNTLPYFISYHLDKASIQEKKALLNDLNIILKKVEKVEIKKQLFLIRNYLMMMLRSN